jgi:GH15 family glucan-1,4-alpha-glucosidase
LLTLPLLGIETADFARVHGTIDTIRRELRAGGPLLYRYPPGTDGLPGTEGTFLPCSFWLVLALAASGRAEEAMPLFDELIQLAGPLGLFAEQIHPDSHRHLGNYPQARTQVALIQAALALRGAVR